MIYFNQEPLPLGSNAEVEQLRNVLEFRENFPPEGMWWGYEGARISSPHSRRERFLSSSTA